MAEKADLVLSDSDEDTSEDDNNTVDDSTPSPRFWHFSQLVEGNVYVGGGNIPQYKKKKARDHLLKTIEEFNVKERKWLQLETTGDHHPGLTGVACASFRKYLFAYGGNNSEDLNGVLSQLDLDTLIWSQLSPETADGPMKKDASGMVHFGEDGLAVMCGYATPRDRMKLNGGSSDRDSSFIIREGPSADCGGWTNEMHIFNHKTKGDHPGMWTPFSFEGPRPPPCADFSLTSVDLYRAVLYGGHRGADENSNDLYVIDFSEKKITRIKPESKEDKWPKMRLGHHAACCLDFNTKNPQLLISGGRIKHELPSKDIWILNLATQKWKQVELPIDDDSIKNQLARWGHTFTAITHSEGLIEVIMFGGSPGYYEVTWDVYKGKDFRRLSFPVSFILGFLNNKEWVILDVLDCSIHWTSKTTESMPFNLDSPIMLDVLYSMERDEIPILTEVVKKKIRSTICSEDEEAHFKWPTFTKPSFHEPTWENLILILKLVKQDDLIKMIQQYLKKMKGSSCASRNRKRPASDSDIAPSPKRVLLHKTKSQDSNIPIISEDVDTSEDLSTGVEVLQKTTVTVTNSECTFEWEGYGLKLHIPENSLPSDMKQIKLTIIASIAGHYKFPENSSLFSGVYWFCYEPLNVKVQLKKPVKLAIQHCAKSDCISSLSFVRASSNQEKFPYTFKCLMGGDFTSCNGTLEVNNFCGICIAGLFGAKRYIARVFYHRHETVYWDICIAVILDDNPHRRASEKKFFKAVDDHDEVCIDFESDEIILDIPQDALEIEGWLLYPTGYPMIKKERVDNSLPDQIPYCRILADIVDPGKARRRPPFHRVNLLGAKPPSDFINLKLFPSIGGGGSAHGSSRANTPSDNPPSTLDLPKMLRILLPLSSQWMNIGTMLSLNHERLTAIKTRCRGLPDDCLREMLNDWLQQTNPPPTRSALVDAVGAYDQSLADRISSAL